MNRESDCSIHIMFVVFKKRFDFLVSLSHERGILEVFLALNFTLYSSIVDLAYFLRVKSGPFLIIEGFVKCFYVLHAHKIDESITNIAFVEKIYWQIKKVKFILELFINGGQHLLLGILVGDVSYHQCGPVLSNNLISNDLESLIILYLVSFT